MNRKIEVELSPALQTRLSLGRLPLFLEEDRSTLKGLLHRLVEEYGKNQTLALRSERKGDSLRSYGHG